MHREHLLKLISLYCSKFSSECEILRLGIANFSIIFSYDFAGILRYVENNRFKNLLNASAPYFLKGYSSREGTF